MLEDKGFPNIYVWLGFSKHQDGVTYRRVVDDSVVDPDSPSDPFEGWLSGYPYEGPSYDGYDYIMSYTNDAHEFAVYNYPENHSAYFGCEY